LYQSCGVALEVWFNIDAVDGIHLSNTKHAISTFTEKNFKNIIDAPGYRLLVKTEGQYMRGYVLINLNSFWNGAEKGFEIDKL
jgi:diamine N-acetyltransferase